MKYLTICLLFLVSLSGCHTNPSKDHNDQAATVMNKVIVSEVIQAKSYTYLRVGKGDPEEWLAVPGVNVQVGDTLYYDDGFHMTGFESKELNRKFTSIIFLEKLTTEPASPIKQESLISPGSSKAGIKRLNVNIPPSNGSISISELYSNRETYSGNLVTVRGQVTKFSPEIMGRNWIHLQDGSEFNGSYDLTITSDNHVKPGDTVSFHGRIVLDKDLGYGYFYDILMEDAELK